MVIEYGRESAVTAGTKPGATGKAIAARENPGTIRPPAQRIGRAIMALVTVGGDYDGNVTFGVDCDQNQTHPVGLLPERRPAAGIRGKCAPPAPGVQASAAFAGMAQCQGS